MPSISKDINLNNSIVLLKMAKKLEWCVMAQEICSICGLPKDLCVCQEIVKEEQRIKVRVEKRKWGRSVTIIEGIDSKDVDLEKLATKLKSALAAGGTAKGERIEVQGDHRYRAKELLVGWGYPEQNIDVS